MRRRTPRTPALRRLRRVRWSMTVAFAAVTAVALLVLAAVTLHLDDESRQRDARDAVLRDAEQVGLVATAKGLDLDAFQQEVEEGAPSRYAVLSRGVLLVAAPDQRSVPDDAELATIVAGARTRTTKGAQIAVPELVVAPDERGVAVSWDARAAAGAADGSVPPGSVVLLGEPVPRAAEHARLAGELLVAALLLALAAAAGGHLISGRAMRPALTALAQQEQFLTEAAHELRTPLATLRVILDDRSPGGGRADRARTQVVRLEHLVQSLLVRARADVGRSAPDLLPLRLDQLVEQTVAEVGDGRVALETVPVVVRGEPQLLALAVRNLVDNAMTHGGRAPVTVRVTDGAVSVADHGPGIAPARRDAARLPGVTGGSGTGSGLPLVEWAARLHHGSLSLGETPGGGLTAELRLPTVPRRTSSSPHRPVGTLET